MGSTRAESISEILKRVGADGEPPPSPLVHDPNPGIQRLVLHVVYNLLWLVGLVVASPWWAGRALHDRDWRAMVLGRLTFGLPPRPAEGSPSRILVHGVSVGEVKAAQSLIRSLQERYPEVEIVISTTTGTGVSVARQTYPGLLVVRFPIDVSWLIRRFLRRVRPQAVILMELEIWPNFLRDANRAGVPVAVVNGRITPRSFERYSRFRRLLPQFNRITLVCAQDERYAERFWFLGLDPRRLAITGNVKVDGLPTGKPPVDSGSRRMAGVGEAGDSRPVLVAGSTHEPEERLLLEAADSLGLRMILVPRHPDRSRELSRQLDPAPQLWTAVREGEEEPDPDRPLLVDTIGELERIYGLADLVFVGGSLIPHGGQNMLEPAAQGLPVVYGPHVSNFRQEAMLLEEAGAALRVQDAGQLRETLEALVGDPARRQAMSEAGIQAVRAQRGAAQLTLEALARAGCVGQVGGAAERG